MMYQSIPTFSPTPEEFANFSKFVSAIWADCVDVGMAKIIPPKGWVPTNRSYTEMVDKITIPTPIKQVLTGEKGRYKQTHIMQSAMSTKEFARIAKKAEKDSNLENLTLAEQENDFWDKVNISPPLYGADMLGTLFDEENKIWNPQQLGSVLDLIEDPLDGITRPYLYFGMWKAMFGWHTEDMDLCSINYVHFGKQKHWYCLPASSAPQFEALVSSLFPKEAQKCDMFFRHKTTVVDPQLILKSGIQVYTGIQEEGQFMITLPKAYHAGFNHGYNCAESVNFATVEWFEYGRRAKPCTCTPGMPSIDMDIFTARYDLWNKLGHNQPTEEMLWDKMKDNGVDIAAKWNQLTAPTKKRQSTGKPRGRPKKQRQEEPQPDLTSTDVIMTESESDDLAHPNKKDFSSHQFQTQNNLNGDKMICSGAE